MGPRASMGSSEKRKITYPCWNENLDPLACGLFTLLSAMSQLLSWYNIIVFFMLQKKFFCYLPQIVDKCIVVSGSILASCSVLSPCGI